MTFWQRARRGMDVGQLPLVVGLALLLVLDGLLQGEAEVSPAAGAAVAVITLPLLWRNSAPRTALLLTVAGVFMCLSTIKPYEAVVIPPMVAAYSVAIASDRLRSLLLAPFVLSVAVVGVVLYADAEHRLEAGVTNSVLLLLAVAVGDAVRSRRANRLAAEEREAVREREQQAEAQRMVAEERLRIAQEVHDVVAHAMVAINVQAGVAAHVHERRPDQVRTALQEIKELSGAALRDLRGTLGLLRDDGASAPVRPTESLAAVSELAGALRAAGIEVDLTVDGLQERVPVRVGAAAYRIVQEASTNILRHAGATRASIAVGVGRDAVDVLIDDDGAGQASAGGPVEAGTGSGLPGMAERAAQLGGHLDAGRQPDGGWRVHAVLPLS